jgi:hypothetical protein
MHNILNFIEERTNARSEGISRRGMLKGGALLAGGALAADAIFTALPARADAGKVPKSAVAYLGSPRGDNRCELCVQYQPPSDCKLVQGAVSPLGSCTLFARKK